MGTGWLCKHSPRPHAVARLFCFPYAGTGSSAYRLWGAGLPPSLEVCPVQLPGRENRLREPALTSIAALVDALTPALAPHLDLPFAFFGHSMGAVLAVEVARAMESRGMPQPRHLFVSGRRPPHLRSDESEFHALPDTEFVAEINRRYGGIPPEVLQQKELLTLLLPCLRADIVALETHLPVSRPPMSCPISAFGGADDRLTPREHLEAWRGETKVAFQLSMYPGDHFYLRAQQASLLAEISATLAPLLKAPTFLAARA